MKIRKIVPGKLRSLWTGNGNTWNQGHQWKQGIKTDKEKQFKKEASFVGFYKLNTLFYF